MPPEGCSADPPPSSTAISWVFCGLGTKPRPEAAALFHVEPVHLEFRVALGAAMKREERHQVALGAADILAGRVPRHPGR